MLEHVVIGRIADKTLANPSVQTGGQLGAR